MAPPTGRAYRLYSSLAGQVAVSLAGASCPQLCKSTATKPPNSGVTLYSLALKGRFLTEVCLKAPTHLFLNLTSLLNFSLCPNRILGIWSHPSEHSFSFRSIYKITLRLRYFSCFAPHPRLTPWADIFRPYRPFAFEIPDGDVVKLILDRPPPSPLQRGKARISPFGGG
jgi:hypothetical protein